MFALDYVNLTPTPSKNYVTKHCTMYHVAHPDETHSHEFDILYEKVRTQT